MKLAAGNPNLKNRYKHFGDGPILMERTEHTAMPRTFNHMKDGQVYVPEKSEPARAGATDAFKVQSRGYRT
jgi:hypothetical protein